MFGFFGGVLCGEHFTMLATIVVRVVLFTKSNNGCTLKEGNILR